MRNSSKNSICWKNRGCVKTFFSLAVVILLAYILIDALPVNSQSVRAFRENYKNSVDAPPKVRTVKKNSNEKVSDGVRSKIMLRNKHQTVKKPSSEITTTGTSPRFNSFMSLYPSVFYEETNGPHTSTVSPFGKYMFIMDI